MNTKDSFKEFMNRHLAAHWSELLTRCTFTMDCEDQKHCTFEITERLDTMPCLLHKQEQAFKCHSSHQKGFLQ